MSTHLLGFRSFFCILQHFVLAKLATSIIRVKASRRQNNGNHGRSIVIAQRSSGAHEALSYDQ